MIYDGAHLDGEFQTVFARRACAILFNFLKCIPEGYQFYIPANICPIVPITFLKAKIQFTFLDISKQDLSIDHESLLMHIEKSSAPVGVLYSRPYGYIKDTKKLFGHIKDINADSIIIDDRCLCVPDFDISGRIDCQVDLELYSTGKSKIVDVGGGGFGHIKKTIPYQVNELNFSQRDLNEIKLNYEAALSNRSLFSYDDTNWLDTRQHVNINNYKSQVVKECALILKHKEKLNKIYQDSLPRCIQLDKDYQNWRFNIFVQDKAKLISEIFEENLFASGHYANVASLFEKSSMHNTESIYAKIVNLFNDRYFTEDQALRVSALIKKSMHI